MPTITSNNIVERSRLSQPSGTPYQLPDAAVATEVDAVTDQLHIGNRWIGHKGLDIYDNTARMHDPVLGRYHTVDPLFGKYPGLSPWSHCAANPLNAIDPTGLDVWQLDDRGYFTLIEKNDDEFDTILGRENASIQVDKNFINSVISYTDYFASSAGIIQLTVLLYSGESANIETYKFLADNSSVEWSYASNGTESKIGTSNNESKDATFGMLHRTNIDYLNSITEAIHSHIDNSDESEQDNGVGTELFPNEGRNVNFKIYKVPTKTFKRYYPVDTNIKKAINEVY